MYNLIKTVRGSQEIVMTDTLTKVRARMKTLRDSHRKSKRSGERVTFSILPSDEEEKFKKKPHNYNPSGDSQIPRIK